MRLDRLIELYCWAVIGFGIGFIGAAVWLPHIGG